MKHRRHLEAGAAKDVLEEVPSDCPGDSNLGPTGAPAQQRQSLRVWVVLGGLLSPPPTVKPECAGRGSAAQPQL